jgi:hypothetical protein
MRAANRFIWTCIGRIIIVVTVIASRSVFAADVTFNIVAIPGAESDPLAGSLPGAGCPGCVYGDLWQEGGYVYLGTDVNQGGMNIFSISNSGVPTYLTRFAGDQFEDVEVWDGIGYFGSDTTTGGGTGVDIVNLAIPFEPIALDVNPSATVDKHFNGNNCTAFGCGHNKVHTLSVLGDYLYTSDNATDSIIISKINRTVDPVDPSIVTVNPQVVKSLDLGLNPQQSTDTGSHEVIVRDNRMYIASKDNFHSSDFGWVHIYDVSDPANPLLLKKFTTFDQGTKKLARAHTALPSADGKLLIVAEERSNGNVYIFNIEDIDQPNDPDEPELLSTLNRTNVGIDAHSPHHPHLHGNLLFIPWYEAGLQVFNIVDPANPVHVGSFDTYAGTSTAYNGNWGVDLSLGLDQVLLSDRSRGLIVVNATGVLARGDYDQNLFVNDADYDVWRQEFGSGSLQDVHTGPITDGNYDEAVDAADYVVWRKFFGTHGPGSPVPDGFSGSPAVPEPATLLMVVTAACAIFAHCQYRPPR